MFICYERYSHSDRIFEVRSSHLRTVYVLEISQALMIWSSQFRRQNVYWRSQDFRYINRKKSFQRRVVINKWKALTKYGSRLEVSLHYFNDEQIKRMDKISRPIFGRINHLRTTDSACQTFICAHTYTFSYRIDSSLWRLYCPKMMIWPFQITFRKVLLNLIALKHVNRINTIRISTLWKENSCRKTFKRLKVRRECICVSYLHSCGTFYLWIHGWFEIMSNWEMFGFTSMNHLSWSAESLRKLIWTLQWIV